MSTIKRVLAESISIKQAMLDDEILLAKIEEIAGLLISTFKNGNKVLLCGNGGSAADALHIATELSGKFYLQRAPLNAEALTVNTPGLTAISNDYSFENIFSRTLEGKGKKDDVLIAISTSGNSKNVLNAILKANEIGMISVGFSGETAGKMKDICQFLLQVPSEDTARIQEAHITLGHAICEIVERKLFEE